MSRCTAPVRGHRTARARAACPVCGGYGSYSTYSSYRPVYESRTSSGALASPLGSQNKATPPLDKETAVGLALIAAIIIGLVVAGVVAFMPDDKPEAPAAKVWDAPSQGFLSALAAAGVTPADDTSAENFVESGKALCARFGQPQANKEDIATVVQQASNGQLSQAQSLAMVNAANTSFCPTVAVPEVAVPVPIVVPSVPNLPNVPSPPQVSSGGGGGDGGESRFCRRRWWC